MQKLILDEKIFKILITALLIAFIGLCFSCDIYKKADKQKNDIDYTEQIQTVTKRIGDTVRYEVPVVRMKDTTIYTYNKQGTTLKTVYLNGSVKTVECQTSAIEMLINENRRLSDQSKEKHSEKKRRNQYNVFYVFIRGVYDYRMLCVVFVFHVH